MAPVRYDNKDLPSPEVCLLSSVSRAPEPCNPHGHAEIMDEDCNFQAVDLALSPMRCGSDAEALVTRLSFYISFIASPILPHQKALLAAGNQQGMPTSSWKKDSKPGWSKA